MLKETRHDKILSLLEEHKSLLASDLCSCFNVTPMTIRRDLAELEKAGKLIRTHGGALPVQEFPTDEHTTSFTLRSQIHVEEKRKIAQAAFQKIKPGQKLFLGAGTTVHALCKHIPTISHLTIATDTISLAYELSPFPNIHLVMIGGEVNSISLSTTGNMAEDMLVHFKFDAAFVSLTAIDQNGQMYLDSITEFGIMQVIFSTVDKVYLMVDSSKIGRDDFVCIGKIVPGYTIITDSISEEIKEGFEKMDVNVIVAK